MQKFCVYERHSFVFLQQLQCLSTRVSRWNFFVENFNWKRETFFRLWPDLSTFIRRSFNLRQRSAPSEFDNWSILLPFVTFLTHCPVWNITFLLSHFILRKMLKLYFFSTAEFVIGYRLIIFRSTHHFAN